MRFVVVSCSRCGAARVAEARYGSVSCQRCGRRFPVTGAKRHFECDSLDEARAALAAVNSGDPAMPATIGAPQRAHPSAEESIDRALRVARELTGRDGDFTELAFAESAGKAGLKDWRKALGALIDEGHVYEPEAGRYRAL